MKPIRKKSKIMLTTGIAVALILTVTGSFAQDAPAKVKEVGLVFSNLNSFGLRFKCGNEKTLFRITALSLNGNSITNSYDDYSFNGTAFSVPSTPSSAIGGGLNIGFEKRKRINDKSYFYWGIDWINSYSESKSNTTTPSTYTTTVDISGVYTYESTVFYNNNNTNTYTISSGLGFIAGYAYKLSDSFSIMAELVPSVSYRYMHTTTAITTTSEYYFGNPGYQPVPNSTNQTVINKGVNYSLTNAAAGITIAYRL